MMTHSNGVEDNDFGGALPTATHTRRFTLRLSDHSTRDSFDEFSYIELLNSELHEGLSSFTPNRWRGDFYLNAGTLDIHVSENRYVDEETSLRKKQKLVIRCLSQDSQEIFHPTETASVFPSMITKQEGILAGEIAASNLFGSVSSSFVAGTALQCYSGAKHLLPTATDRHSAETKRNGGSCPTENHTSGFGHLSAAPEGLPPRPICPPFSPDNLPHQLFDVISQIKQAIGSSEFIPRMQCGRLRFTKEINQLLVQVENLSQSVTSLSRDMVFHHLASLLSCEQEFLSKRAKKLCLAQNGDALKDPISQLKEEIQNIMPSLIERHNEEILAAERLLMLQLENKECSASTITCDGRADEEIQDFGEERMKRITFPRKKFRWNQAIRLRLCEVVQLKMQQFKASKIQSQTAEEYLKAFLDAEIKPLWPRGWIQTRMLFKESRTSHKQWTINLPKLKRMCVFGNKLSINSSIAEKEIIASGSLTSFNTTSSSISDCTPLQAKTLMDFAKTSCQVKSFKDEDRSVFDHLNKRSQTIITNQKWCTQLEKFSRTVGSGVSALSPTPILSPTLAAKYWLLKAALESRTDCRGSGLCGAVRKTDAVGFISASSVAFASTSSLITCSEAAASSVKTQASKFVGRSIELLKSPGGNGVAEGSCITDGGGITERTSPANEIGSVRTPSQELSQHQNVKAATISHSNHLQSKSFDSNFRNEKRMDTVNSPGNQSLSSSCSGFPSIFVFPSGTPLVGLVFCRAPMTSPLPFPAANPSKLQRNPTDASLMRSILCGPCTTESSCHPLFNSDPTNVPHPGCTRNDADLELSAKQTMTNAPPPESTMLMTAPLAAFPGSLSVCRQSLAPVTTP